MKKIIIVGTGISGLSIAKMLDENYNVDVLEKKNITGGLIKCERINGDLFHKVGGHVFNSKNQKVLDWFWKHFDRDNEFLKATRNAKIDICNIRTGYPIENYLYQLPKENLVPIVNELLEKINIENSKLRYSNFKEFLIGNFGQNLYNLYFEPYNKKIWRTNLDEIPLDWLDGKLPMPKLKEILLSNIVKNEETEMVHSTFFYPVRDGSQFIVNRLSENLNITTSVEVNKIELISENKLSINNGFKIAESLVYCGDVRVLNEIIQIDDEILNTALSKAKNLKSNGTSNVLCEVESNDMSWLYLPENQFESHRIIYTGNFSNSNNRGDSRKTCVVEFSGKHEQSSMIKELDKLPGNLKPLAFNYEPNSYIIQNEDTRVIIQEIKELLKPYNIYLLGRFAEWEYFNMDKCIDSAMKIVNENFGS